VLEDGAITQGTGIGVRECSCMRIIKALDIGHKSKTESLLYFIRLGSFNGITAAEKD